jgi:hypothetical protein
MNRNIQIGKKSKGCTWIRVFDLPAWFYDKYGLSENCDSFTGQGVFGISFYVNKDTPDGKRLVQLLEEIKIKKGDLTLEPQTIKKIYKLIERFTFKSLTMEDVLDIVEDVKEESFKEGQKAKINELKKVLDIRY